MKILFGTLLFLYILSFVSCTNNNKTDPDPDENYYDKCKNLVRNDGIDMSADKYDEYFKHQWHLASDRYFSINIIPAWEITKGAGIKVAVLDDGIQKNHEDFENIDVYDVINGKDNCEPSAKSAFSHGTAVSGIIAARQNKIGIMGVAPECDFLFIGDSSHYIYEDAVAIKAFEYAKNQGAKVINCSWGSGNASSIFESQIKSLYDSAIVVVFACGNDHKNLDWPGIKDESEIQWVIGVSASNKTGNRANFSNYGKNIDIMAPGDSILSANLMGRWQIDNNYAISSGTSFSAPIVAGVAALILSVNPSLSPSDVRKIIIETAQKTCDSSISYDSEGFSLYHAYGLIDAGEAVMRAAGVATRISE